MKTEDRKRIKVIQPIVKWVGGKRQILPELIKHMPQNYKRYFEPFIGGGALFFKLERANSYISDINEELINLYKVVRDDIEDLIEDITRHEYSKEYYYKIRNLDRTTEYRKLSTLEKASRFLYLNKTCFNGIYRVNKKGEFNVPFGRYKNPRLIDKDNLVQCSHLLQKTEIVCADFSNILSKVKPQDFVYLDPPYIPLSKTSNFTGYTKEGFTIEDQEELKAFCDRLNKKGVYFMLSNSDTPLVQAMYDRYTIRNIYALRCINSIASQRGKIVETIITNYR